MKSFWRSFQNYGLYIVAFVAAVWSTITYCIAGNSSAAVWAGIAASWVVSAFFSNYHANLASHALGAIIRILVKQSQEELERQVKKADEQNK